MDAPGPKLYEKAKRLIPTGTQLLSKRSEQFAPGRWPAYFDQASGVEVRATDGRTYIDMSMMGIGACVLGYSDPSVDDAVKGAIEKGTMSTLNCPEEVELAELLIDLHPWAGMVRYARTGGEAMAIAVRIARNASNRDKIAFCGYHGWHDWYLSANLAHASALDEHLIPGLPPAGVPSCLEGSAYPFHYNDLDALQEIVSDAKDDLGAVVMEPIRNHRPKKGFLQGVRDVADDAGVPLIFDEVSSGMRLTTGGAHLSLGVEPDIAVFAKALSNGYPMAAIAGRTRVMEAAQTTFISSTYWTERMGPVAALATLQKHREEAVGDHLVRMGSRVQGVWADASARVGVPVDIYGIEPLSHFKFVEKPQASMTLFTSIMLEQGFLAGSSFYASYAHTEDHIERYDEAVDRAFEIVRKHQEAGTIQEALGGSIRESGFARLT